MHNRACGHGNRKDPFDFIQCVENQAANTKSDGGCHTRCPEFEPCLKEADATDDSNPKENAGNCHGLLDDGIHSRRVILRDKDTQTKIKDNKLFYFCLFAVPHSSASSNSSPPALRVPPSKKFVVTFLFSAYPNQAVIVKKDKKWKAKIHNSC